MFPTLSVSTIFTLTEDGSRTSYVMMVFLGANMSAFLGVARTARYDLFPSIELKIILLMVNTPVS